jgi:hypothetical protein
MLLKVSKNIVNEGNGQWAIGNGQWAIGNRQ